MKCAEKLRFDSREAAQAKADSANRFYRRNNLKPYQCECGAWHLTSSTVRVRRPCIEIVTSEKP